MNPWIIIGFLVALIVTNLGSYHHGRQVEEGIQAQSDLDTERLAAATLKAKQARVDGLALDLARAKAIQSVTDRKINQEVSRYAEITPAADRCTLPGTWRVRHDLAATGELPDPARLVAGDSGKVEDATALETVADNYQDCREWRGQLIGWQRWWGEVNQ